MAGTERVREAMNGLPALEHLVERAAAGWRLTAMEWERAAPPAPGSSGEPPYGMKLAGDGAMLVENPIEREIVIAALDLIVDDRPLSHVAAELNRRGYATRANESWTPTALFQLLPRMIEMGPRLFTSEDWVSRKQRLERLV